jgi:chromosome segregation ATPase
MEVTAPEEQANLDLIRNRITMSEGELKRLRDLRVAEEYAISELVKSKAWHQDEIAKLEKLKSDKQAELDSIEPKFAEARNVMDQADSLKAELAKKHEELEAAKKSHEDTVDATHNDINQRERALSVREQSISARESALNDRESKIKDRESKIASFVDELKRG